jgi:hypothetical protein
LLDALSARDSQDAECWRKARDGSALQRHHGTRRASSRLAEKLRRMAAASRNA